MHYQDSRILPKHTDKAFPAHSIRRGSILSVLGFLFNRLTCRLSIRQKIGFGYILSISVAVFGTGVGLVIGEYYDDKAVDQLKVARDRYELLDHLEKSVWQVNFHHQKLIISSKENALQSEEINDLKDSITEANNYLNKLKINFKDYQDLPADYLVKLKKFSQVCDQEVDSYSSLLQELSQRVNLSNPTSQDIQVKQQILQKIIDREQADKFEELSDSLEPLVNSTVAQAKQAADIFKRAKVLRLVIIVASMALSMVIATLLAYYTSRAIARPIKAVTKVAKRATQDGDFELKAPVISNDEIGVLATSLNLLIQKVATQIRELKQAQAQLIQSEKMSSLGQMVAGIAHEINNPVNFIYANLEYANNYSQDLLELVNKYQHYYPQPNPEIQKMLEEIELEFINEDLPKIMSSMHSGSERIRQIILSLRNFCHLDEAEIKSVDIHQGLENTLLLLNHRIPQEIEVIKQYSSLPLLECYPAQLNQVFWHIISNAIDELLNRNQLAQPQILIETTSVDSTQVEVRVRDNGRGIAPQIKDKIFDPFFTTKPIGEGTGLGLAICYQIVEKHRGKIQVISELGQGTEVVVTLPMKQHLPMNREIPSLLKI